MLQTTLDPPIDPYHDIVFLIFMEDITCTSDDLCSTSMAETVPEPPRDPNHEVVFLSQSIEPIFIGFTEF